MATTVNYGGRFVDLLIFQNADYSGKEVKADLSLAPGQVISGVQKVVQRWAILFLTSRGTVIGDDNYGTYFMTRLIKRQLIDESAVQGEFALAARDVIDYLYNNIDITTLPDDEVITEASLLPGWSLTRTSLKLRVGLTTRAGKTYTIVLPVKVAIK
jgi:hypothetical protein